MTALVINDLPVGKDLDRAAMASITGGHGGRRRGHHKGRRQSQRVEISDNKFNNKGDVVIVVIQGDVTAGDDINFG